MKTPNSKKPTRQSRLLKLFEIAESQQGFFTAKQAQEAGFSSTNHPYYVKQGVWVKEERSIYRLKQYPNTERMDLILYSLWSRDRNDRPQGVYSHETALTIHELSDVMPSKLYMTVPPGFRKSAKTPKGLSLSYDVIDPTEIENRHGYRVTKPLRTILDLVKANETSPEFIEQALVEAIHRGVITLAEFRSAPIPESIRSNVERVLSKPARRVVA